MKKKVWIGVAIACVAGGLLLLVGFYGIYRRDITAEERAMLVTIADLQPFLADDAPPGGTFVAKTNIDGSLELEYDYEQDDLLIISEVEIYPSQSSAVAGFRDNIAIYKGAMSVMASDLEVTPAPHLLDIGDECYVSLIQSDGLTLGNCVIIRKNKTVFSLNLTGVYFDDSRELTALLAPKVDLAN